MNEHLVASLQLITMHDFFMLGACLWGLLVIRRLWRGAPDKSQRFVLGFLAFSLFFFVVSYVMRLTGIERYEWEIFSLAALPMQYAVIIALFRVSQKQEEETCRKLRAASQL